MDLEGAEEGADGNEGGSDGGYAGFDERPYHGWGSGVWCGLLVKGRWGEKEGASNLTENIGAV